MMADDGDIRVAGEGAIAPATLGVAAIALGDDDELDRAFQFRAHGRRAGLPVQLGQGDRGDAVIVHVLAGVHAAVGAIGLERIEEELHARIDLARVVAFLGEIARGQEGEQNVAGDGHRMVAAAARRRPGAIGLLLRGEVMESAIDHGFRRRIDHDGVGGDRGLATERRAVAEQDGTDAEGGNAEVNGTGARARGYRAIRKWKAARKRLKVWENIRATTLR